MFSFLSLFPFILPQRNCSCFPICRPAKERLRRYFRLSSRQSESDNKLASHRSVENSVTQENTTETLDEPIRIYHTQSTEKSSLSKNAARPPIGISGQIKSRGSKSSVTSQTKNRYNNAQRNLSIDKKPLNDELNVSCSNITTSTYCNGNGISNSSGIAIDFDSTNECRPLCDRESVYSGVSGMESDRHLLRSRELLTETERISMRRESSSTYEHDMDMIDLLERERSMDIQDMLAKEKRMERERERIRHAMGRKNSGCGDRHRKLPDITKINAPMHSPKRGNSGGAGGTGGTGVVSIAQSTNIPNFVFTHQQKNVSEQKIEREGNRTTHNSTNVRRHSKRNSDAYDIDKSEKTDVNITVSKANIRRDSNETRTNSIKTTRDGRTTTNHGNKYVDKLYFDDL